MPSVDVPSPQGPKGHLPKCKTNGVNHSRQAAEAEIEILDIRRAAVEINLKESILSQIRPENGPRTMPTLLLYDERGLQLFEEVSSSKSRHRHPNGANPEVQITYLDEYYLTNDEIALLKARSAEIAEHISSGSMVIELGSG
jgi:uncharacterized SAM-dependent methyltransferase